LNVNKGQLSGNHYNGDNIMADVEATGTKGRCSGPGAEELTVFDSADSDDLSLDLGLETGVC
jgi:hypothetical protein